MTPVPNCKKKASDVPRLWFLYSNHRTKMCLKLVCKCTVGASHLKMLEVNKLTLFGYLWSQHLVCIIHFTFIRSFTWYVDIHILSLTEYSTQMCYSVNISPILSLVVLTERDTNHHLRGTSACHSDLIPA